MARGQLSEEGRKNLAVAQKRRWAKWRKTRTAKPLPVLHAPNTNGLRAELNITLHIQNQVIQLTQEEAAGVYDALGIVLHKHGLSAT